jgi:hypothetical protein
MTLEDKFMPHIVSIFDAAMAHDEEARNILALYGVHYNDPDDHGALTQCEEALDEWIAKRSELQ